MTYEEQPAVEGVTKATAAYINHMQQGIGAASALAESAAKIGAYYAIDNNANMAWGNTLPHLTTGHSNTAVGSNALLSLTSSPYNTALGYGALEGEKEGNKGGEVSGLGANTAIGVEALKSNSAEHNTAVGAFAGENNTTGRENTFLGAYAGRAHQGGEGNTAVGTGAMEFGSATVADNTAIGQGALSNATTSQNTAVGQNALHSLTSGGGNTGIGAKALLRAAEGTQNTTVGQSSGELLELSSSSYNTAVGYRALRGHSGVGGSTGQVGNTAVGWEAASELRRGESNTALGYKALFYVSNAIGSVAIGFEAGLGTFGSNAPSYNVYIGAHAGGTSTASNKLAIHSAAAETTEPLIWGDFEKRELEFYNEKIGFFKTAPASKPEVTGATVTAKQLAEAIATLGLVKVN